MFALMTTTWASAQVEKSSTPKQRMLLFFKMVLHR